MQYTLNDHLGKEKYQEISCFSLGIREGFVENWLTGTRCSCWCELLEVFISSSFSSKDHAFLNSKTQVTFYFLDKYATLSEGIYQSKLDQDALPVKVSLCGGAMLFSDDRNFVYEIS